MTRSLTMVLLTGQKNRDKIMSADEFKDSIRFWYASFEKLVQEGLQLRVLSSANVSNSGELPFDFHYMPSFSYRLRDTPTGPVNITITSPTLIWALRSPEPKAILALEYSPSTLWSWVSARLFNAKFWIFQEAVREYASRERSQLRHLVARFLANRADRVLVNSRAAETDVLETLRVRPDRVHRVPLLSAPLREYMLSQNVPVPPQRGLVTFLAVSRLIPLKNLSLLIRASADLRRKGHQFKVWIVGEGELREQLEEEIARADLTDTVVLLGSVPYQGIGHLYRASDVFVFPTLHDLYGMSALEAMRFGKPLVVSSGAGVAGDLAIEGDNAIIFDPSRHDELAAGMEKLLLDRGLRDGMGRRSEILVAGMTSDAAAAALKRLLEIA